MRAPVRLTVYDKTFARKAIIGAPKFVTVIPRFNKPGSATVGLLASDRSIPHLLESGCRMTIQDELGDHLLSGRVSKVRGRGPAKQELVEVDILDDFAVLSEVLGWVVPTGAITEQGTAGVNWELTGPMETVLKSAVQANAIDRLGLPIVCAPDLGRGPTITAKLRFHPLYDRLFPVVDGAGIDGTGWGVTVKQVGAQLVLDVFEPSVYPRTLTAGGGVLREWSYDITPPTATRVVVGGQGEAQLRNFRRLEDLDRETDLNWKIERFRDARDTDDPPTLYARGQETLDEGAGKSGLSMELSNTKTFRYGSSVKVGDRVTVQVGPGVTISDVLTEATLSWTQGDGWKTTPKIGERADDVTSKMLAQLRKMARHLSNQDRT